MIMITIYDVGNVYSVVVTYAVIYYGNSRISNSYISTSIYYMLQC